MSSRVRRSTIDLHAGVSPAGAIDVRAIGLRVLLRGEQMRRMSWLDRLLGGRLPRSTALAGRRTPAPVGLWALLPVNGLALVAAMALVSSPQPPELASLIIVGFAMLNAALGGAIAYRLNGYELASNRREHVRLTVQLKATLSGEPCELYDVSLGGASVSLPHRDHEVVGEQVLELQLHGETLVFRAEAVRARSDRGRTDVALRFLDGQDAMTSRLAVGLLRESHAESATGSTSVRDAA